jgi:CheY-like chemotaxis protein
MNLVVNAFDAIRNESGDVSITTECQSLTSLKGGYSGITPGNYVILSVSDTGVGIAPEDQQKIFEPYFSKKKMGTSGSGLGLAVVYGIVIDHSGYYDLKSDIGSGSTFTLYFPMTSKQLHVTADLKELYHGTEKILVVDDVAEQREVATALLSSLGYVVHTASTPTEAIQSAISNMYDLIVMDVNLESTLDGLDIYQEILSARPEQKAIVASGFSENDRVKQMLTLGAYGYLRKPYTRAALSRSVRQALDAPFRESTTTKIRFSEA